MDDSATTYKHFLDTSVARPMLLSSRAYKQYFSDQFGDDDLYISMYVQMEVRRSYICPIIHFYFQLDMPTIQTVGDAFAVWSNRFKSSEQKAVIQLVGNLADTQQLNISDPYDKEKVLRTIGRYIKRLDGQLRRRFRNIGVNTTRCPRPMMPLTSSQKNLTLSEQLRRFSEQFEDPNCRSQCRVDRFVLDRYRAEIEDYIESALSLVKPRGTENKGFVNIVKNLQEILQNGPPKCSCHMCKKIGDAVIALETPRDMRLEHTDHSFDHLCATIDQPHHKHPSESSVIKSLQKNETSP